MNLDFYQLMKFIVQPALCVYCSTLRIKTKTKYQDYEWHMLVPAGSVHVRIFPSVSAKLTAWHWFSEKLFNECGLITQLLSQHFEIAMIVMTGVKGA